MSNTAHSAGDPERLLAEIERLTAERDELREERLQRFVWRPEDGPLLRNDNEAHGYETRAQLLARAEAAERERDELLIERGEWDSWKNHAEACQRERDEARALLADHIGADLSRLTAAEALAERRGAIVLAADAATRYPEDHEAFGRLSALCEQVTDAELDELRAALADGGHA